MRPTASSATSGVPETIPQVSGGGGVALVAALKTARCALGWNQQDLAAASGVSKVTIARMEAGMMSPRLSTLSALQIAMEGAGARFALNDPPGGFTLRVDPKALEAGSLSGQKAKPSATAIEELVQEVGGVVAAENAGHPRDIRKRGSAKMAEISRRTAPTTTRGDTPHAGHDKQEGAGQAAEGGGS
jgi:transcriptional regulator with XRE-family HTH domain